MSIQKISAFAVVLAISGILPVSVTFADQIYNNLDLTIDATLEAMSVTAGNTGAVSFKIHPTNGDGDPGCNFGVGESATFNVLTSNAAVATVAPGSVTFAGPGCGGTENVTVTGVAIGSATISLSAPTSNNTGGSFDVAPAAFTVIVSAPAPSDVTAPIIVPTVTPSPNGAGWNNTDVTVSWSVTDPESAVNSTSGCDTSILTDETAGTTLTCTATSTGGTASQSVTVKIDKTKPVISGSASPLANGFGWNNTNVAVSFACAETGAVQSGVASDTVAGDTITTEGAGQSVTNTGNCIDAAGNNADSATVSGINIDKTAPTATGVRDTPANGNGWNNTTVNAHVDCSDNLSGITNSFFDIFFDLEGANQSHSAICTDKAGNTAVGIVSGVNIDETKPIASANALPLPNLNGWNNSNVTVTFTGTDALSGIDSCNSGIVLNGEGVGQSASGVCADKAGNISDPATASGINIDKTPPTIFIAAPANGGSYTFHQTILADWLATDGLSGIDSVVGTAASGNPIDTTSLGLKSFTVTATDKASNVSVSLVSYTVLPYNFGGFNAPLSISLKDFKKMSTIPVKFQLFDTFGNPVSNAVATLTVNGVSAVASGSSNVGNLFRYDPAAKQYIFNLSTKMPAITIGTNKLVVTLDDGTTHSWTVTIK